MTAYKILCNNSGNLTEITCSGDLTIRHIKNILSDFIINNSKTNDLVVELKEVEFIDLTFLQVLLSYIRNHCQNETNTFVFKYDLEEEHLDLLKNTGYVDILETYQTSNHVKE